MTTQAPNHENSWTGRDWSVLVTDSEVTFAGRSGTLTIPQTDVNDLHVRRRWFRCYLHRSDSSLGRLRGLRSSDAIAINRAFRHLTHSREIGEAVAWHATVTDRLETGRLEQRWIHREIVDDLISKRPLQTLLSRVEADGIESVLTERELTAVRFLGTDLVELVAGVNSEILRAELESRREFFDTIEKTPLTDEQASAVVCFDNRVQLLAAAGSGKTSVMVARAAYAVARGFVSPERILLLAFNRAAAAELQERVDARFAAAGIDSTGVRASTFHAFGRALVGKATGRKPRLARWIEQGDDARVILEIVDQLRDESLRFRYRWDLYRMLYANAPTELTEDEPDGYNKGVGTGYRTFAGEIVKSHSERLIANFLFLNGIKYEYERDYEFDLADADHAQYRPDFFYPDIGVWHEHWALDRNGEPPTEFEGYAEGIAWKRRVHARHGTRLVESTWGEVMFGDGLTKLEKDLTEAGLTFDWNPDRPVNDEWARPMRHEDLVRLVRTFMAHIKSNSLTAENLESRLANELGRLRGFRTQLFLDVYWPIHAEWQRRLEAEESVDFEDMLVQAANHLEASEVEPEYELILVDEFQDASQARARLVRGLLIKPDRFLLAVGDDWQAINRFAGSDLSVMTEFETWFGRSHQLELTTTFRCTQTICDVASEFVSRNPLQFSKKMRSAQADQGPPVCIIRTDSPETALASYLDGLYERLEAGDIPAGADGTVGVDILGRYGFQRDLVPTRTPDNLEVTFRTVHSSKGLEADYIVVVGLTTGTYGFPSNIADDPVLDVAMPTPEDFPHAEERRLLYVALTRARRQVTLITPPELMSPFAVELLDKSNVSIVGEDFSEVEICAQCRRGIMVTRRGPFGPFLGCSTFPRCDYKRPHAYARETDRIPKPCPACGRGRMVPRRGRFGLFLGCTEYPACTQTEQL